MLLGFLMLQYCFRKHCWKRLHIDCTNPSKLLAQTYDGDQQYFLCRFHTSNTNIFKITDFKYTKKQQQQLKISANQSILSIK